MPYYHVHILDRSGIREEFDFSKDQLIKFIVDPYSLGKRFMFKGLMVSPSNIRRITIIETEKPSSELFNERKAEMSVLKRVVSEMGFGLLKRKGRDVTREVLFGKGQELKSGTLQKKTGIPLSKSIFIVHGRDHKPMKELKAMLKEFDLIPIVLHEQPSGSRTIVEKLDKYSDVGYAFVILTPDDTTSSKFDEVLEKLDSEEEIEIQIQKDSFRSMIKKRARQNVILEFGYFMGKLNRDKVCCLLKGDVERPSDMHGIVYIPFKESVNEVIDKIAKELKAAGYGIKI